VYEDSLLEVVEAPLPNVRDIGLATRLRAAEVGRDESAAPTRLPPSPVSSSPTIADATRARAAEIERQEQERLKRRLGAKPP
jgi:hypothetical protein